MAVGIAYLVAVALLEAGWTTQTGQLTGGHFWRFLAVLAAYDKTRVVTADLWARRAARRPIRIGDGACDKLDDSEYIDSLQSWAVSRAGFVRAVMRVRPLPYRLPSITPVLGTPGPLFSVPWS